MNNEPQSQWQLTEPSSSITVSLADSAVMVRGLQAMVNVNHQIAEDYKQQLITCRNLRELDQQNYSRLQAENDRLEKEVVELKNRLEETLNWHKAVLRDRNKRKGRK